MTVNRVSHVGPAASAQDKLKAVRSHARGVAEQLATTRVLRAPNLPAAHRQDKKSAIVQSASMADIYFLGEPLFSAASLCAKLRSFVIGEIV